METAFTVFNYFSDDSTFALYYLENNIPNPNRNDWKKC